MSLSQLWFVFDRLTNEKRHMLESELQAFILSLDLGRTSQIYVWREGWTDWRRLDSVPSFRALTLIPPPTPPPLSVENSQTLLPTSVDRRKNPRFNARLQISIKSGNEVFKTFTKDVSISGFSLEEPVPEHLVGKTVEIEVAGPDLRSTLALKATPIADQKEKLRFAFLGSDPEAIQMLERWVKELIGWYCILDPSFD